jgi:CO/xanthine dehydrogenase Mo-binding subunit
LGLREDGTIHDPVADRRLHGATRVAHPVRCTTNPLGVKGVGEAGTTASLAAARDFADGAVKVDV